MPKINYAPGYQRTAVSLNAADATECLQSLRDLIARGLPLAHSRKPLENGHNILVILADDGATILTIGTRHGDLHRLPTELAAIEYRPELTVDTAFSELILQLAGNFIGLFIRAGMETTAADQPLIRN